MTVPATCLADCIIISQCQLEDAESWNKICNMLRQRTTQSLVKNVREHMLLDHKQKN
jgi:hypothetical protein